MFVRKETKKQVEEESSNGALFMVIAALSVGSVVAVKYFDLM